MRKKNIVKYGKMTGFKDPWVTLLAGTEEEVSRMICGAKIAKRISKNCPLNFRAQIITVEDVFDLLPIIVPGGISWSYKENDDSGRYWRCDKCANKNYDIFLKISYSADECKTTKMFRLTGSKCWIPNDILTTKVICIGFVQDAYGLTIKATCFMPGTLEYDVLNIMTKKPSVVVKPLKISNGPEFATDGISGISHGKEHALGRIWELIENLSHPVFAVFVTPELGCYNPKVYSNRTEVEVRGGVFHIKINPSTFILHEYYHSDPSIPVQISKALPDNVKYGTNVTNLGKDYFSTGTVNKIETEIIAAEIAICSAFLNEVKLNADEVISDKSVYEVFKDIIFDLTYPLYKMIAKGCNNND